MRPNCLNVHSFSLKTVIRENVYQLIHQRVAGGTATIEAEYRCVWLGHPDGRQTSDKTTAKESTCLLLRRGRREVRQFGLLNRTACLAKFRLELGEAIFLLK